MQKKMENVKEFLGAMKVEQKENGYYIRFRKSKTNKIKVEQYCEILELEDERFERLGEYELLISNEEFEDIYKTYMGKLYAR